MRCFPFKSVLASLALALVSSAAGPELPSKAGVEDLDSDASRLINDLPSLTDPEGAASDGEPLTLERARKRLQQAQRKQIRWELLLKQGVLSQSEVERCTVEVADALAHYERANRDRRRSECAAIQDRLSKGAADQALGDSAAAALRAAEAASAKADAQLLQTRYDLAKINLARQRRLYAEKMIALAAVQDAEALVQKFDRLKTIQEQSRAMADPKTAGP